jgi:hypothetical protein
MAKCSTRIRTEEEDAAVQGEADSAKDEADEVDKARSTTTTPNFGNEMEAIKEPSEEGGALIPIQVDKTQSNADIAGKSVIAKRSAERRCVSRRPQADNSRITPSTPTTMTTEDYS